MEAAFYIAVAALLFIGPVVGFVFGVKCCAGWFGIDLHPGDTMQVLGWDEMPEVYRPHFLCTGAGNKETDATTTAGAACGSGRRRGGHAEEARQPAEDTPADDTAQEAPEDGLQGEELPTAKVHAEDAVDALLTALDATRVTQAQVIKGTGEFLESVEAYRAGAAVGINSKETVEITLEPDDDAADPAALVNGGPDEKREDEQQEKTDDKNEFLKLEKEVGDEWKKAIKIWNERNSSEE